MCPIGRNLSLRVDTRIKISNQTTELGFGVGGTNLRILKSFPLNFIDDMLGFAKI